MAKKKNIEYKKATKEQLKKMGLSEKSRAYIPAHITRVTKATKHISRRQAEKISAIKEQIKPPSKAQIAGAKAKRELGNINRLLRERISEETGVNIKHIRLSEFKDEAMQVYNLKKRLMIPSNRNQDNMKQYFDFFPSEQWNSLREELYPKNSVFSGKD